MENRKEGIFPQRLVVKAIGSVEQIQHFVDDLQKLYPQQNLSFSHIIKNRGNPGFHCFINIILPSNDRSE